jgi:hypothetical protein
MVFELFSHATNFTTMPSIDDLWVRFLFRNGTDRDAELLSYPLLGRGNSQSDIRWLDFVKEMNKLQIDDMGSWYTMCNTSSIFCHGENNMNHKNSSILDRGETNKSRYINAFIAGVIGYVIEVAILMLSLTFAALFGGVCNTASHCWEVLGMLKSWLTTCKRQMKSEIWKK